jgi:hypothetical protein
MNRGLNEEEQDSERSIIHWFLHHVKRLEPNQVETNLQCVDHKNAECEARGLNLRRLRVANLADAVELGK